MSNLNASAGFQTWAVREITANHSAKPGSFEVSQSIVLRQNTADGQNPALVGMDKALQILG